MSEILPDRQLTFQPPVNPEGYRWRLDYKIEHKDDPAGELIQLKCAIALTFTLPKTDRV